MADTLPAVELFTTSILSNHKVRHRHERYIAVFAAKKIDYVYHDMASDEEAKKRFRRKALDQQIPNILVHNEWRGTFEEFEESVEFGELDLFLRIDPSKVATSNVAAEPLPPSNDEPPAASSSTITSTSSSSATPLQKLPPAPSVMPRMAPVGSGAGPKRDSASDLLASIDLAKFNLTDDDIDALLEEAEPLKAKAAHQATTKAPKTSTLYPGEQASAQEVKRTYFPSENAGVKPLRLPKMGNTASPSVASTSTTAPTPSSSSSVSPNSSSIARFSASQNSTRALAAEASASASSRNFSARQVRAGLDSGKQLQDVLGDFTASSSRGGNAAASSVDALFEDLGLGDINMSEQEAEAFLLDGIVPDGLELGGSRIRRSKSKAGKAREEEAAKSVAAQARDLAADRRASAQLAKERKERKASLNAQEMLKTLTAGEAATQPGMGLGVVPEAVPEISDKTKEMLEKAREKRASRLVGLPSTAPRSEPDTPTNTTETHLQSPLSEEQNIKNKRTGDEPDTNSQAETKAVVSPSSSEEPSTAAPTEMITDIDANAAAPVPGDAPRARTSLPAESAARPPIEAVAEKPVTTALSGSTASASAAVADSSKVSSKAVVVDETLEPILDEKRASSSARPSRTSSAALDETLELVFDDDKTHAKTGIEATPVSEVLTSPKGEAKMQVKRKEPPPVVSALSRETVPTSVDTAAAPKALPKEPAETTPLVEEKDEKIEDLLARLQNLGKSMGSGLGKEPDGPLAPPAPIAKSPPDAAEIQSSPGAPLPRKPRERDTSSNSSGSRRAIDVQRTTIYPATISPSSSFSGNLPSTQGTPRSPPTREGSSAAASASPIAGSLASPQPASNGSASTGGSTSKSPKLKGRLSRIRSFGSMKRSASSSSNLSSPQQQQQQSQSPSSPREVVPEVPSLASVASITGTASSSAPGQTTVESPQRTWRLERTLSQVLRDADAALGEDADLDGSSYSYEGASSGDGVGGAGKKGGSRYRQSVLMPDDGLGEPEITQ
ncbi:hypothetical protein BCV69DRAFT_293889 [Microstroma glucosiphilum]|uniref:Uncharacterized protein n=1 Tax=Pseudomicrostroma glucosiphilum TaxID=1684307 RepID=A0A316U681_9BASI|nr:hypothetical protein BCV69DRAFT_293889 [Pseudomicrostroma glucosiphilum]PWN20739.1 hypothetical protein BCV69DRAFT_293889 [Pseudomicrostroma glucosiphilum]